MSGKFRAVLGRFSPQKPKLVDCKTDRKIEGEQLENGIKFAREIARNGLRETLNSVFRVRLSVDAKPCVSKRCVGSGGAFGGRGGGFGGPGGGFLGSSESSGKATTGTTKKNAATSTTTKPPPPPKAPPEHTHTHTVYSHTV